MATRVLGRLANLGMLAAFLLAPGTAVLAQEFSGRVVTLIVNNTAGGPTDIEARIVARHLSKHLNGVRGVVVRNVGGNNVAINQLGEAGERDRLGVGFFTWNPVDQLIGHESLRVRYTDLKFIAGYRQVSLEYARRDTPPGLKRPADIARAPLVKAGALSPNNQATLRQRLALDLLGVKYDTISGYKGMGEVEFAMRRGDVHLTSSGITSWHAQVKPNMVDTGIAMPLFQFDYVQADGKLGRNPDLPDIPAFSEIYAEVMGPGSVPSGERWQALQLLNRIMDSMFRTVFMPPAAPAGAVEELRGAFASLEKDAEYVADFEKVARTKPRLVIGSQGEAIIAELGKVQPSFLKFFRDYVAAAR